MAEAASFRRGLADTTPSYCHTAEAAVAHLRSAATQDEIAGAIQSTAEDTASAFAELAADEAKTEQALAILQDGAEASKGRHPGRPHPDRAPPHCGGFPCPEEEVPSLLPM